MSGTDGSILTEEVGFQDTWSCASSKENEKDAWHTSVLCTYIQYHEVAKLSFPYLQNY